MGPKLKNMSRHARESFLVADLGSQTLDTGTYRSIMDAQQIMKPGSPQTCKLLCKWQRTHTINDAVEKVQHCFPLQFQAVSQLLLIQGGAIILSKQLAQSLDETSEGKSHSECCVNKVYRLLLQQRQTQFQNDLLSVLSCNCKRLQKTPPCRQHSLLLLLR